jgi:hypothetical protein
MGIFQTVQAYSSRSAGRLLRPSGWLGRHGDNAYGGFIMPVDIASVARVSRDEGLISRLADVLMLNIQSNHGRDGKGPNPAK